MSWILEKIELAERDTPSCPFCGERTVAVAHPDGSVWLECPAAAARPTGLRRWLSLDLVGGHTRRLVIGADDAAAAA